MGEREILDSWKAIANYLKRDKRTCQRYERELELPVHRLEGSPRARVFAYTGELDAWRDRRLEDDRHTDYASQNKFKARALLLGPIVVLVFGLAVFLFIRLRHKAEGLSTTETIFLAVLPFQNGSGRSDPDKWTLGLPDLLTRDLAGSKYFSVVDHDRIAGVLRDLDLDQKGCYSVDDVRRIEAACGATHSVTGLLHPAGKGLEIVLTTRRIGSDEIHSSRFECEDEASIILAIDRMADQIRRDLGLTRTAQTSDFDASGVPVTTCSLEAFRLYNEGRRLQLTSEYAKGAEVMRRALARDPEFALAWRSLAALLESQGADEEAGECHRKALDCSRNASPQERYFIRTSSFHYRTQFSKALQISLEWSSLYPYDTQARLFTGRAYLFEEDPEGSLRQLDEALQRGDKNPFLFFYSSLAGTALGRYHEAAKVRDLGSSVHPHSRLISRSGVIDALVRRQYDLALGELDEMRRRRPEPILDLMSGDVLLLKGDFPGAERAYVGVRHLTRFAAERLAHVALAEGRYVRAAELAKEARDSALLAYVESRRGRLSEGLAAAQGALGTGEERGHQATILEALLMKGMIETLAGDLDDAKVTAARLMENGRNGLVKAHQRAASCVRGIVASAEGRKEQAVEEFRTAVELLPTDVPYLDDQPHRIGMVAGTHALILFYAGKAFEKAGNPAPAIDLYRRVIDLTGGRLEHPDLFALSHHAIGRLAEAKGDLAGARECYAKFLELWKNADPGLPEVEEARARLAALGQAK